MKLYKLTDQNGCTHGGTQWAAGRTLALPEKANPELCGPDVIHAYRNANLAFLINPIGANFDKPLLWEATGNVVVEDWGKVGCFELTTVRKLEPPEWTLNGASNKVCVAFAVLCAKKVLHFYEEQHPKDDRVRKAIEAAEEFLRTPAAEAAWAAMAAEAARAAEAAATAHTINISELADKAARTAARTAARAAARAARAAWTAWAAWAETAARTAARAAEAAATAHTINISELADKAARTA